MRERRGRVIETRQLAEQVTSVTIECRDPASVRARAGQFLSIRVPGGRRSYSIVTTAPKADRIELVLKATPGGGTAAFLESLVTTEEVSFFGPMGYFLLEPPDGVDVVLGATGVGITPLVVMAEEALVAGATSVQLFWGLRHQTDQFFTERFDALKNDSRFSLTFCFSGRGDGYITAPLASAASSSKNPHVYLSGRFQMIRDVIAELGSFDPARIHTEVFFSL